MSNYLQHVTRGDTSTIEYVTLEIFNDDFNYKLVKSDANITAAIDGVYHEFTAAVMEYKQPDRDTQARVVTTQLVIPFFDESVLSDALNCSTLQPLTCIERIYLDSDLSTPAQVERVFSVRNPTVRLSGSIVFNLEYETVSDKYLTEDTINNDDYPSLPL